MIDIRLVRVDARSNMPLTGRYPSTTTYLDGVENSVRAIVEMVRQRGDMALLQLSAEYDSCTPSLERLRVDRAAVEDAYSRVSDSQVAALVKAKERIEQVSEALLSRLSFVLKDGGMRIYFRYTPLDEVGCYVPGGEASYPSSLLMCAVPAKTAGVRRVVVCTPPRAADRLALTLVAADLCRVDEVYLTGGAQAIAALAYGTESIRPVQKIVGPGNSYVTAAKRMVSSDTMIDMPAGPSELLVLADDSADPTLIALDMISQAEHSVEAVAVLVTNSMDMAQKVRDALDSMLSDLPREDVVRESLRRNGALYVCETLEECIGLVNDFAPEHLEIVTRDPDAIQTRITSAGLVLLGPYTPVAASDYGLGVNHVLPTSGYGRVFSSLSVLDFVRFFHVVEATNDGLRDVASSVCELAEAEGLRNHARAVRRRLSD
ncbi:MAG: histidinol dehydrogenase [Candidatus Thorarchaeota archaeon]|nr:histidinol dehydrogenase [Candidatus Thorarchaeota archaeon]